jgi:hypothetical protein
MAKRELKQDEWKKVKELRDPSGDKIFDEESERIKSLLKGIKSSYELEGLTNKEELFKTCIALLFAAEKSSIGPDIVTAKKFKEDLEGMFPGQNFKNVEEVFNFLYPMVDNERELSGTGFGFGVNGSVLFDFGKVSVGPDVSYTMLVAEYSDANNKFDSASHFITGGPLGVLRMHEKFSVGLRLGFGVATTKLNNEKNVFESGVKFALYPELELNWHLTQSFAISAACGYAMVFDGEQDLKNKAKLGNAFLIKAGVVLTV